MEEVLTEFYRCGICQERITYPKKLKCQHVFCHECVVVYIAGYFGQATFPCPVCEYKHLPDEQETVISQNTLLILEEDCLMRDLRRFFKDGKEPSPVWSLDGINRECIIHNGSQSDYFCPDCNMLACTKCRRDMHMQCGLRKIDKDMCMEAFNNTKKVAEELADFLSETETVHTKLNTKFRNSFTNSAMQVETVKLYYLELKEKVIKYLEEHERKLLEKAAELKAKETAHLKSDVVICTKMASAVKSRQRIAHVVKARSGTNAPENLVIANHLQKDCEAFKTILPQLQSDIDKDYNVRFMINTEFEDTMTDTDVVKIEVVDCCHRDASAVTFGEETGNDQHVSADPESAQSTPIRSTSSLIGQPSHQEEVIPPPPPEDEEPPPMYTSIFRQSFIQRRRPSVTSVVRRNASPSAPPLPTYHDTPTPSRSAQPPYHDPSAEPPYPTHVVPLRPSAPPPIPMSASSHLSDFQPEAPSVPTTSTSFGVQYVNMLKFLSKIDTKGMEDHYVPSLVGIAALGGHGFHFGCFVVVDKKHCRLTRVKIDAHRGIVDTFNCGMEPWDVAGMTETLCVVTAPKEGKLLFVNFSSTPGDVPPTLQWTMETGKYTSIGYCKSNETLICGRGPPFCAARIDILRKNGQIIKYIDLKNAVAVPRNLIMSGSRFLALCDIRNHEAMVYDMNNTRKPPVVVQRLESRFLREPQGIAILPILKSFFILDASSGDVFITTYSGTPSRVLKRDIRVERQADSEIKTMMSISMDQKMLAVAHNTGTVSFYEIGGQLSSN